MNYEAYYTKAQTLSEVDFKQIIGVKKAIFSKMEQVLYAAFQIKHVKGRRLPKLPVGVQLLMILNTGVNM
jgi:hypothetical protein